jgi:hypothetical protein
MTTAAGPRPPARRRVRARRPFRSGSSSAVRRAGGRSTPATSRGKRQFSESCDAFARSRPLRWRVRKLLLLRPMRVRNRVQLTALGLFSLVSGCGSVSAVHDGGGSDGAAGTSGGGRGGGLAAGTGGTTTGAGGTMAGAGGSLGGHGGGATGSGGVVGGSGGAGAASGGKGGGMAGSGGGGPAGHGGGGVGAAGAIGGATGKGGAAGSSSGGAGGNGGSAGGGGSAAGGSGGSTSHGECTRASDCVLQDDCCSCAAGPKANPGATCTLACLVSQCGSRGISAADVACAAGRCVLARSCDPKRVTCAVASPACPVGSLAAVAGNCYTGSCLPVAQCSDVGTCVPCTAAGLGCVREDVMLNGPTFHCVTVPPACSGAPTCQCLGVCVGGLQCLDPASTTPTCVCPGC